MSVLTRVSTFCPRSLTRDVTSPEFLQDTGSNPNPTTTTPHQLADITSIDNQIEVSFLYSDPNRNSQSPSHNHQMAKSSKRGRDEGDTYEADDFVEDDDGRAPKSKKSKKAAPPSSSKSKNKFFEVSSP